MPSSTTFGKTVSFTGSVTNDGTSTNGEEDFTSVTFADDNSQGLSPSVPDPGPLAVGTTAFFFGTALISNGPDSTAQVKLRATGITASATVADPQTTFASAAFTVTDAVVLSVGAERKRDGSYTPCPSTCSVSVADELRYTVRVDNLSDVTASDVWVSAPTPSGTMNLGTSTIPSSSITLGGGQSMTYVREVAVNDELQLGQLVTFQATATYDASAGLTTLDDEAAGGSPSSFHLSEVDSLPPIAPDCSAVSATPGLLKADGKLHQVALSGATHASGEPLTYSITGVTQDEPTTGGFRNDLTTPDANGVSGNKVSLRGERNPSLNGRVYRIHYVVKDGSGDDCSGFATVGVPVRKGVAPVDDGAQASWNSFTGALVAS
ncbi:MAG: hypothetical protein M3N47_10065 [Chloroflexota bacterium]|nr:hypothetical protein [Chloroflexota bacterium]